MPILADQIAMLDQAVALELRGTVTEVRGLALRVADLSVPVGSTVSIRTRRGRGAVVTGEVVGFDEEQTIVMPMAATSGIGRGDQVICEQASQYARVGESLLGRVLDGQGQPIDGKGPLFDTSARPLFPEPLEPMDRKCIDEPLATGVRAIDTMTPVGRGQRVGIFAAPGVGKSTLLGTMAKHTAADVSVVALVGERGREVRDFVEHTLGPQGLSRSVVIAATGDEPALLRIRAAALATTVAEYFRDQGLDVLLLMDSVTRLCQAQRQVGLAAGEPPATKGYPPSVFAMLAPLLERSGRTAAGSITGLYSVLVEGDDMNEPISDACRGILDGHVLLSRKLAERGHYPAIDVLASISRVANDVTDPEHGRCRREVLKLVSSYNEVEDLLNIGAYAPGSNAEFDVAIACKGAIDQLLQQGARESSKVGEFAVSAAQLKALVQRIQQARQQQGKQPAGRQPVMPR